MRTTVPRLCSITNGQKRESISSMPEISRRRRCDKEIVPMCEIETGGAPFLTKKSILPLFLGKAYTFLVGCIWSMICP
jgi:hypothetical protein